MPKSFRPKSYSNYLRTLKADNIPEIPKSTSWRRGLRVGSRQGTASQTGPGLDDPYIQQDDAVTADHYQQQPPLPDYIHDSYSGMHAHSKYNVLNYPTMHSVDFSLITFYIFNNFCWYNQFFITEGDLEDHLNATVGVDELLHNQSEGDDNNGNFNEGNETVFPGLTMTKSQGKSLFYPTSFY